MQLQYVYEQKEDLLNIYNKDLVLLVRVNTLHKRCIKCFKTAFWQNTRIWAIFWNSETFCMLL